MKQPQPDGISMTKPLFQKETSLVVSKLQKLSQKQLIKTLEVSDSLGELNYDRYQKWSSTPKRAALWMYAGDVYNGIDAYSMTSPEIERSQQRITIVSGLYGLLRPLDAIQPYRLEMRLPFKVDNKSNLYEYWHNNIKTYLESTRQKVLLLCASQEYAVAITQSLPVGVTTIRPRFMQETDDGLKEKGLFAKYARGKLARWVIDNDIQKREDLEKFAEDGFSYSSDLSTDKEIVYIIPRGFSLKGRFVKK